MPQYFAKVLGHTVKGDNPKKGMAQTTEDSLNLIIDVKNLFTLHLGELLARSNNKGSSEGTLPWPILIPHPQYASRNSPLDSDTHIEICLQKLWLPRLLS